MDHSNQNTCRTFLNDFENPLSPKRSDSFSAENMETPLHDLIIICCSLITALTTCLLYVVAIILYSTPPLLTNYGATVSAPLENSTSTQPVIVLDTSLKKLLGNPPLIITPAGNLNTQP